jgi:YVTN family beta-propeller protein
MAIRNVYLLAIAIVASVAVLCALLIPPALATRLPVELKEAAVSVFPHATVRLDGSLSLPDGSLILPLVPAGGASKKNKYEVESRFPEHDPVIVFYANGWAHVKTVKRGRQRTISLPKDTPEKLMKHALSMRFPSDLIVPEHFVLPKSLKPFIGDLQIATIDDATLAKPEFGYGHQSHSAPPQYTGHGTVVLTSINTGTITLLDGKTMQKLVEFPTEGTPCSMLFLKGVIYIADQGKHRVLMLDPSRRRFLGQIDLPAGCAPRGIAALPNSKLFYVSESGQSNVAVIEHATGKLLLRTKVPPGPGRMTITPDGVFLLVLNVSSGDMTVIATYNQKVVGTVKVGAMPTAIALGPDGRTAYVSCKNSNHVAIVDVTNRRITGTIKTGMSPTGIALTADGHHLFVANARDNSITEYDTKTLTQTADVKLPLDVEFPGTICLLPGDKKLVVTSQQTDAIGVMDVEKKSFEGETRLGHPVQEVMWAPVH